MEGKHKPISHTARCYQVYRVEGEKNKPGYFMAIPCRLTHYSWSDLRYQTIYDRDYCLTNVNETRRQGGDLRPGYLKDYLILLIVFQKIHIQELVQWIQEQLENK